MLKASHSFDAIGTSWAIETHVPLTYQEQADIEKIVNMYDATYSRFRDDSLVSTIHQTAPGSFMFPESIHVLYDIYSKLYTVTDGAVSPLVGSSMEALGYDASYSLKAQSPHVAEKFEIIEKNGTKLTFTAPALLDVGAVGKGLLVDILKEYLQARHEIFVIDASGDMTARGDEKQIVGLEHPYDADKILGTVIVKNRSLCASATNRRRWGNDLHHIIDARTGLPVLTDIVATWAIAPSTALADALATGLFFVGPLSLQKVFGDFSYVIFREDHSVEYSLGTAGEIFG